MREVVQDSYHEGECAINQTRLLVSGVLRKIWIFLRRKNYHYHCLEFWIGKKNKIVKWDGMN